MALTTAAEYAKANGYSEVRNPNPNPNPNAHPNPNPNPHPHPHPHPNPHPEQVLGVPVQRLREDASIGTLDLTGRSLGVLGARLLAFVLPAATSVCNLCVRCNELGPLTL